ncbi:hypothetical protein COLO4_20258 [Corchorus olitorius]|uniref:CCHC-type domain-containing protein n=1 Tax=Corchorus olitorius TaxID=93759 RepID=A0A1R3J0X3_9ROSI|nr:hypothetical protein COLO4_20258 [Corchorus olitorius]
MKNERSLKRKRFERLFYPFARPFKITGVNSVFSKPPPLHHFKQLDKMNPNQPPPDQPSNQPPNQPPNQPGIHLLRECSWTDSGSSSMESGDSADSHAMRINPDPIPDIRSRQSHRFSYSTEQLQQARNEGAGCLIGFLQDVRRFSTEFVQSQINRAWELRGVETVLGRDEDRFLIHFTLEIDRRVGILGNPWNIQGAVFVLQPWVANIPLSEVRLLRMECWLQLWGLPFEYQQPFIAADMARSAGEVIGVDWVNKKPRNIRFVRVKVSVDLNSPLMPGSIVNRDDGTSQWVQFRYERINKLCMSCGMVGHNHRYCTMPYEEAERRINTTISRISQRYNLPINREDHHPHFTNRMRAFLTRVSRRTTRIVYRPAGSHSRNRQAPLQQPQVNSQTVTQTDGEQTAPTVNEHDVIGGSTWQQRDVHQSLVQPNDVPTGEQNEEEPEGTPILNLEEEAEMERQTEQEEHTMGNWRINIEDFIPTEPSVENIFNTELDQQIANLQAELGFLEERQIRQPVPLQIVPPEADELYPNVEYPMEPIEDPMQEFDNITARVERIY